MNNNQIQLIAIIANIMDLAAVALILTFAFLFQFLLGELPCPLCLLQRVGFLIIGIGFLANLRFGFRPSHYVLSLLGALFTAMVALRQITLHIVPGTGSYGDAILGFHLYTWSFIASMAIILWISFILALDRQFFQTLPQKSWTKWLTHILFAFMIMLAIGNFISVLIECGITQCPDNPEVYHL